MTNAVKFGETAEQIENTVKTTNAVIIVHLRPYCSLIGLQMQGPITYPTRYIEVGKISCASFVLLKCFDMGAVAPAAKEEFIVEFITVDLKFNIRTGLIIGNIPLMIATKIANIFFVCRCNQ